MEHKFQIDLRGLIDLLSNHLYSGPEVFVRELLQNATDAIRARTLAEPGFEGELSLEAHARRGKPPTLLVTDNGIGLTADEVHKFLATIGQSSKKGRPTDFIGQFGIGILSCFVVSDEIVVVTRSAKEPGPALEWKAKPDGTYSLRELSADLPAGTQVALTAKADCAELFEVDRIRDLARTFGGLLPYPVRVSFGKHAVTVNEGGAPWRQEFSSGEERTQSLLAFGKEAFGEEFFDAIPLRSGPGEVDGVAFVLPHRVSPSARKQHRIYLKNMFLTDHADNLLPDWAFFIRAVVNANDLRPTASRESFYEDKMLAAAQEKLGQCLRSYLVGLSRSDPGRLERLIRLHHQALKALAVEDDEFYELIIDWLPFQTSQGEMAFGEYRRQHDVVRFVSTVEGFRQIAPVAAAQNLCVINGGYVHDTELLQRAGAFFDGVSVEEVDPAALAESFEDLGEKDASLAERLLLTADNVLKPYGCRAEGRRFRPIEVPALYAASNEGRFLRTLENTKQQAGSLFGGVLDALKKRGRSQTTTLCFNFANPLVRRLCDVTDKTLLRRAIELLYVQALLLGHHPLSGKELRLLSDGLLGLIEWGVQAAGDDADG